MCVNPPLVPVTVSGYVPGEAVPASTVRTEVDVVDGGASVALAPPGTPLTVSATDPAKPPVGVTVTVLVPVAPAARVSVAGGGGSAEVGRHDAGGDRAIARPPL